MRVIYLSCFLTALLIAVPVNGDIFTLDFEGLGNGDPVLDFYNGGTSGQGFSGTNYGVSFSVNALGLIDSDEGGSGNFENEPSPSTILYFTEGSEIYINVPEGFEVGFATWYLNIAAITGTIEFYDDLNGSGNLLTSGELPQTDFDGEHDEWEFIAFEFDSSARSIRITGMPSFIGFDDMTFGAIPSPGALFVLALAPFVVNRRRRS